MHMISKYVTQCQQQACLFKADIQESLHLLLEPAGRAIAVEASRLMNYMACFHSPDPLICAQVSYPTSDLVIETDKESEVMG